MKNVDPNYARNLNAGIKPVKAKCMMCEREYLNRLGYKFGHCLKCKINIANSGIGFDDNTIYSSGSVGGAAISEKDDGDIEREEDECY